MRPTFRRQQPTKANARSVALMMLTGATDAALARHTADSLARSYGLKVADAAQLLEQERGRRARHG